MQREIIRIDESLCNGCGDCVPSCAEGALQIIDGKVRLVSDLLCDGLGACIGQCPLGAISIERREAEPYDEVKVIAPLPAGGGCPGSRTLTFAKPAAQPSDGPATASALRQWPIQLHLVNPAAPYFQHADLLVAADCVAFAVGDFHARHLAGKSLVIACPKLDSHMEIYVEKIRQMVDSAGVKSITVMVMEVPCCGGLLQMVRQAVGQAVRPVPVTLTVVGLQGEILSTETVV
jgi:NAD-dependent dihydropyrimidine dehydrogenase PreA subunit